MIQFHIPGNPQALKRHRTYRTHGFTRQVDPSKNDKADFLALAAQYRPNRPLNGPLEVELEFRFSRPKSHYGTGKNAETLKESAPFLHTIKPDLDNLTKFVLDALNGIFWLDDAQIYSITATKSYTPKSGIGGHFGPGVDIWIIPRRKK